MSDCEYLGISFLVFTLGMFDCHEVIQGALVQFNCRPLTDMSKHAGNKKEKAHCNCRTLLLKGL